MGGARPRDRVLAGAHPGRWATVREAGLHPQAHRAARREPRGRAGVHRGHRRPLDAGEGLHTEGAIAKYLATEAGNAAADAAIQAHGGYGYTHEYMVEKIRRDVRITTIYEGTSEIMEMTIARDRWQLHLKSRGDHYHALGRELEALDGREPNAGRGHRRARMPRARGAAGGLPTGAAHAPPARAAASGPAGGAGRGRGHARPPRGGGARGHTDPEGESPLRRRGARRHEPRERAPGSARGCERGDPLGRGRRRQRRRRNRRASVASRDSRRAGGTGGRHGRGRRPPLWAAGRRVLTDPITDAVAIVGLSAILPQAPNAGAFWENVKAGRYAIDERGSRALGSRALLRPRSEGPGEDLLEDRGVGARLGMGAAGVAPSDPAACQRRDGRRPEVGRRVHADGAARLRLAGARAGPRAHRRCVRQCDGR